MGMLIVLEPQQRLSRMSKDWIDRRQHYGFYQRSADMQRSMMSFQFFQIYCWKQSYSCSMLMIVFRVLRWMKMLLSQLRHYFSSNYLKSLSMFVIYVIITSQSPLPKSMNKFPIICNAILLNQFFTPLVFGDLISFITNYRKNCDQKSQGQSHSCTSIVIYQNTFSNPSRRIRAVFTSAFIIFQRCMRLLLILTGNRYYSSGEQQIRYYSAWIRLVAINAHLLSSKQLDLAIPVISLVISSKDKQMHQKACYQCSEGTAEMKERRLQVILHAAFSNFTEAFTNSQHFCSIIVNSAFSSKLKSSSMSTFEHIAIILQYSFIISEDCDIATNFSITFLR